MPPASPADHPELRLDAVEIVVCVPTFHRPDQLALTLDSLVAQDVASPFAVVVAENDARARRGAQVAERYFVERKLLGLCVVEPRQGNCHAINAAFAAALDRCPRARFVLMIDDDEIATPHWLRFMVSAAERTGAGVVGGPVHPRLAPGARPSLARHPAFAPGHTRSGPVPLIYGSGNCLITRETFAQLGLPAFDLRYNFLGGGDLDFFTRARRAGIAFHWEAQARITETVPLTRTTPRWLVARALRIGAINYSIDRKHAPGLSGALTVSAKSAAVLAMAVPRAIRLIVQTREPLVAMHPLLVAAGRFLAAIGIEPQQYRARVAP